MHNEYKENIKDRIILNDIQRSSVVFDNWSATSPLWEQHSDLKTKKEIFKSKLIDAINRRSERIHGLHD